MDDAKQIDIAGFGQTATIATVGAEVVDWTISGRPLLWEADPAVWSRTSPILFPIVGRAAGGLIRVRGHTYRMGIHGFAAESRFEIIEHGPSHATLKLTDNSHTRDAYPFGSVLVVTYSLGKEGLTAEFTVNNAGHETMPYALGLHPGFRWPFAAAERHGYVVEFARPERPEVPVITADGLFSHRRRPIPIEGRRLRLDDDLMAREALCFLDAASNALRFRAPDGSAIAIETENFPHIALWARPPAPFLSIEAWTGHGDPDGYTGELADKPSIRLLAPGEAARHAMRWRYEPV